MADFLLEIGCEEIPARMIEAGSQELARRVGDLLNRERLNASDVVPFSTPRRISVMASGLSLSQPDVEEQVMGPSTKVAFKDGVPGPPAQAFAKKSGCLYQKFRGSIRQRVSISPQRFERKAAPRRKSCRSFYPARSAAFIGRKTCTGESPARGLCVRYAGWLPCWTGK